MTMIFVSKAISNKVWCMVKGQDLLFKKKKLLDNNERLFIKIFRHAIDMKIQIAFFLDKYLMLN